MPNFLSKFFGRFTKSKEVLKNPEIPKAIRTTEKEEGTKFTKDEFDKFFEVVNIDFEKIIENKLVKVDFAQNKIVDFTEVCKTYFFIHKIHLLTCVVLSLTKK